MSTHQQAILASVPPLARALSFRLLPGADVAPLLAVLSAQSLESQVVGLGPQLVSAASAHVPGLRELPVLSGGGHSAPSTPRALWILMHGQDRGELLQRGRSWQDLLQDFAELSDVVDTFTYRDGRDLSGYVDGTENPTGQAAFETALVSGQGLGLDGSSFVAVQRWQHDLTRFGAFNQPEQDDIIGRRLSDNTEFDAAPASAHVKRAAQESFEPAAFMLRRSMPWASEGAEGLVFIAFGHSFDAFEAVLRRMLGLEDGISDGLFRFTRPLDGAYYWCPPVKDSRLDLRALAH